ncbi:HpcH/HpaI aldolase family protein [Cupriavidus sp. D39]|uniref:HpcH/HpaI aldolase family protein n=1 Tax=Cupriavidus sp. D39 TaxID=2997877 RepID=UPI00226DA872|nr:aldolase/citrate lyase family protein [Cupriavidus sp. D39]MCY0857819.1 aldolase/citrate lyase family protein [Cupriavidus sp. D39]
MFKRNKLLEMLERDEIPLGMQCFTGHPSLIEVMGLTGFDFVMLDCEHSGNDVRAMEGSVRAAQLAGLAAYVRVPDRADETGIRRALEAGAEGVFLPMIRSAADVKLAAKHAFFPPMGERGICPATRAAGYAFRNFDQYTAWNNAEIALVPMIEHPDAVENIDEICALDEVRIIVFGAGDLAYAMGEGTQMMKSPRVQEAYRVVLSAAQRHGVAVVGGPVLDPLPATCRKSLEDGVRIFCLGLDTLAFRRFCEQTVAALNLGVDGTSFKRAPAPESAFPG